VPFPTCSLILPKTLIHCLLLALYHIKQPFTQVLKVAKATVEYMNSQLKVFNDTCATLRLKDVLNAGMTTKTAVVTDEQQSYYTLTFRTSPGDAVFQGAVEWLGAQVRTDSDILRLNSYRLHAGCIEHVIYKKWCYCVGTR